MGTAFLIAAVGYLCASLVLYAWHGRTASTGFWMLKEMRMPGFADLRWITAESGCHSNLWHMAQGKAGGCDPYRRYGLSGLGYPPMAIWIGRRLGVDGSDTGVLSLGFGLALIAVIVMQCRQAIRQGWLWTCSATLLLISYPVQLGMERMNLDVPLFLLLCLAAVVLGVTHIRISWISAVMISWITIALKIYPLFGYVAWFFDRNNSRRREHQLLRAAVVLGCTLAILQLIPWMQPSAIPVGHGELGGFGLKMMIHLNQVLPIWLGLGPGWLVISLLLICKPLSLASGLILALRARLASALAGRLDANAHHQNPVIQRALINLTAGSWLGCYLTTISYDYKHILLIPLLTHLITIASYPSPENQARRLSLAFVAAAILLILAPLLAFCFKLYASLPFRVVTESLLEFLCLPFLAGSIAAIVIGWWGRDHGTSLTSSHG